MRFFLQAFEPFVGFLFGSQLLKLDAVVVPVELFAQVSDSADEIALARVSQRKALPALKYHFDHAARFCGFHAPKGFLGGGVCSVSRNA